WKFLGKPFIRSTVLTCEAQSDVWAGGSDRLRGSTDSWRVDGEWSAVFLHTSHTPPEGLLEKTQSVLAQACGERIWQAMYDPRLWTEAASFPSKAAPRVNSRAPDQRRTQHRPSGGRESLGLRFGFGYSTKGFHQSSPVFTSLHQSSPVFNSLWAAVEVMLCRRNMTSTGGDIADLKNEKHIPMSPKDGMTVEKVSLAMLAVLGVVGLAYFIATALEVLPIISAS